ncbi:MAG: hypothetical protein ACFFBL_12960 [Promethearchaeota archaeon]
MSVLIKEISSGSVIVMVRPRSIAFLGMAIMSILLFSGVQPVAAVAPDIWRWGIEGDPELGQGFDVWANVSDSDFDLKNVTVEVVGPSMSLYNLLAFNGTFYTGTVPAFPNDGNFRVRILAYDFMNNSRSSYPRYIEYEENPEPPIDPTVTLPVVVGSSLGLVVVVVGLAMLYDKRMSATEKSS